MVEAIPRLTGHLSLAQTHAYADLCHPGQTHHASRNALALSQLPNTLQELFVRERIILSEDAQRRIRRAIEIFDNVNGVMPAADIRQVHVEAFISRLLDWQRSQSTIERYVKGLRFLSQGAFRSSSAYESPLARFRATCVPSRAGAPLSDSGLRELLKSTAFVEARNELSVARAARFWLPLVVLNTGARGTELAQAKVTDIERLGNSWTLQLACRPRAAIPSRTRNVPISTALIHCGFLAYAAQRKLNGDTYLFASDKHPFLPARVLASVNAWLANLMKPERLPGGTLATLRRNFIFERLQLGLSMLEVQLLSGGSFQPLLGNFARGLDLPATKTLWPRLGRNTERLSHLHVIDPFYRVDEAFPPA